MSNLTTSSSGTYTTAGSTGPWPCPTHGNYYCYCSNLQPLNQTICSVCGMLLSNTNGLGHMCGGASTWCSNCNQYFIGGHICSGTTTVVPPKWTFGGTTIVYLPSYKEIKEITADSELTYEWNGSSFDMKLPAKFSDCFLKVGYSWSPLYPLIFSALENDAKEISFHIVTGIIDKAFEGDKVVLKSVSTTKIEDNLTLMQLCERTKEFFKEDVKTNPSV